MPLFPAPGFLAEATKLKRLGECAGDSCDDYSVGVAVLRRAVAMAARLTAGTPGVNAPQPEG